MKKLISLFGMFTLLLACAACEGSKPTTRSENPEPKPGEIQPVPASEIGEGVVEFFETYLPPSSSTFQYSSGNFFGDRAENKCLMINYVEELQALFPSSVEIPSIDFERYTLIIGQQLVDDNGCHIADQSLIIGAEDMTLNLLIERPQFPYAVPPPYKQYHWGLYHKLPQMPISVDITYFDTLN